MKSLGWCRVGLACMLGLLVLVAGRVYAQTVAGPAPSLAEWLARVHQGARQSAYTGTFVVMAGDSMSSARIWRTLDGQQPLERVESLSGTQRLTFRRNAQVLTFFPMSRRVVLENRDGLDLFAERLNDVDVSIAQVYQFQPSGVQRIAGLEADVVRLVPKDRWRYGLTVWSERQTGLVLQLRTHDVDGRALEQVGFSEVQLHANVDKAELIRAMDHTEGYQIEHSALQRINPQDHGWELRRVVEGFKPVRCYQRVATVSEVRAAPNGRASVQWVLSDGLATVSLFMEPFDAKRHLREGAVSMGGATQSVSRRAKNWWLTAVGEAPVATLNALLQGLERK